MRVVVPVFLILFSIILLNLGSNDILTYAEENKTNNIVIKDSNLIVEEYVSGLNLPVMIDFIGEHMLVVEKNEGTIKIIKNGSNLGFGAAINKGIKISKNKYIVIINNDIILDKNWLLNAREFIDNNNDIFDDNWGSDGLDNDGDGIIDNVGEGDFKINYGKFLQHPTQRLSLKRK